MTGVHPTKPYDQGGDGDVGAGRPEKNHDQTRHQAHDATRNGAIRLCATRNRLVETGDGGRIVNQTPGGVAGRRSSGKCRPKQYPCPIVLKSSSGSSHPCSRSPPSVSTACSPPTNRPAGPYCASSTPPVSSSASPALLPPVSWHARSSRNKVERHYTGPTPLGPTNSNQRMVSI